jgi:hypothetical protein
MPDHVPAGAKAGKIALQKSFLHPQSHFQQETFPT